MLYRIEEVWAKEWAGTAEQVRRNYCILRVHLPKERNSVLDLVRASEGSAEGSSDPEGLFWDAVDDRVAPLLELLGCSAWSVYVA